MSEDEIATDPSKLEVIMNWPTQKDGRSGSVCSDIIEHS